MNQATFSINFESDPSNVVSTADALETLKRKADASMAAVAAGNAKLRDLRGTSADVVSIKQKLNAVIDAERSNIAAAALSMVKQGTSLKEMTMATKAAELAAKDNAKAQLASKKAAEEAAKGQKGMGDALAYVGGPASSLKSQLSGLSELLTSENASAIVLGGGLAILAAAAVAAGAAFMAGAVALGHFIVVSGDLNRSLQLSRQWIAGSAADSARMGDQIDRLRQKIPLTTDALSKLYASTRAGFDGARASGQDILNIVTAVGAAQAAGADSAAAKLREIGERGKNTGRVRVDTGFNSFSGGAGGKGELAGTGLDPAGLAAGVADAMKISLSKAMTLLRTTGVDMATYAKAAVYATNKAFGEINAAKLLSLDSISQRLRDDWSSLTKGVNLEPILRGLDRLERLFSTSTPSGYALKAMFTSLGVVFGDLAGKGAPLVETAIRVMILEATKLETKFVQLEIVVRKAMGVIRAATFPVTQGLRDLLGVALALNEPIRSIFRLEHLDPSGRAASVMGKPWVGRDANPDAAKAGLGQGAVAGAGAASGAVVTAPAHAAGGLVAKPAPGEYFASVAPGERIVPADERPGRGGGAPVINLSLVVNASGRNGHEVAAAIRSSSLIADLTKALEDALKGAGVPTQAVAG